MITAIDLGSNSYRVVQLNCQNFEILGEYEETVSTADGLANTGEISNEALDRVVNAIKNSVNKLKFEPQSAICKTTAAMRKAKNSSYILNQILERTGLKFEIISGEEEARLTLLAIKQAIKRENLDETNFIMLDIGGGSCELSICQNDYSFAKSFDFGIVTLTQGKSDINEFLNNKKLEIQELLSGVDLSQTVLISTAGTPTKIAAIKVGLDYASYDRNVVNGTKVDLQDISNFKNKLLTLSKNDIDKLVGSRRTVFMNAGASIFSMFFEALHKNEAIVFDDGLREGIALDWCINKL